MAKSPVELLSSGTLSNTCMPWHSKIYRTQSLLSEQVTGLASKSTPAGQDYSDPDTKDPESLTMT